jgi:hypothetical protein
MVWECKVKHYSLNRKIFSQKLFTTKLCVTLFKLAIHCSTLAYISTNYYFYGLKTRFFLPLQKKVSYGFDS